MMYINIKKLKSWRIRPYKIPSFFFSLLFPFFSLFSSLFFFPPFSFLPPSWCASVPQLPRGPFTTRLGFEPTRAEHNGLAVHRLIHSSTSSHRGCAIEPDGNTATHPEREGTGHW